MSTFDRRLARAEDWIDRKEWTPPKRGIAPEIRLFGRWWNVLWLGLLAWVFLIVFSVGSTWFIETETGKAFVAHYPGTVWRGPAMEAQGFPWWLRWEHYFNLFVMVLIIRSGITILADHPRLYWNVHCTPGTEWFRFNTPVPQMPYYTAKDDSVTISDWLGLPGIRHSGGLARWWHFSCALFWILNGQPLNIYHGAPLRLRCENELGFKQVKWIEAIEFVEDYKKLGAERGGYNEDHEFYSWRDPI